MMKVLGLDPSKTSTGGAVIKDGELIWTGIWTPDKRKSDPYNLHAFFTRLRNMVVKENPDMACIESLSVERNAKTTRVVSHYQAACVLACKEAGVYGDRGSCEFSPQRSSW